MTAGNVGAGPLIGVDWGATTLRTFRFNAAGKVVEQRVSARGLLTTRSGAFEETLAAMIDDWLEEGPRRLILCGMVGSRQGWVEAPYVACPADAGALAARLAPLHTRLGRARIVPGLSIEGAERVDVLRGEETQIFGAVGPGFSGLAVAPGTHAKWARIASGRIVDFRTWMTGELFALLREHSILGRMMTDGPPDEAAFVLGVRRALGDSAVTSLLFGVRAEALLSRTEPAALASYLSGLLIGAEVAGGLAWSAGDAGAAASPIVLIGSPDLTGLYAEALALAGRADVRVVDGAEASARGLWRLDGVAGVGGDGDDLG